jgi:CIC family chloride channel protein
MLLLALLVVFLAGVSAMVFYILCDGAAHAALDGLAGCRPLYPSGEPPLWPATAQPLRPWLLLLLPAVGGLITGRLVFLLAPEAEGHGTDAAIATFHNQEGRVRLRASLVKKIASPVTLGTGGSGGREGPMSQIGAGLGSWVGRLFHCRPAEVRALMAAGMGAGVAAIFRTPLAGALFAGEILYRSAEY